MPAIRGFLQDIQFENEHIEDLSALTREVYINETPLIARFPRTDGVAVEFSTLAYGLRPQDYTLTVEIADGSDTSVSLNDVSHLSEGDVLEVSETGERLEVTAITVTDEATGAGTVTVKRGASGTTPAGADNNGHVLLIGNSQTGAEIDLTSGRSIRDKHTQYHQRFRKRVEMGGETRAVKNLVLPAGHTDPFGLELEVKYTELLHDVERTMYWGRGEAPSVGGRRKMKGLVELIEHQENGPADSAAYNPDSMMRDLFQPVIDSGGQVDVVLMSTGWATALQKWGYVKTGGGGDLGATKKLGLRVSGIVVNFNGSDVTFIPAPLLNKRDGTHTAIALNSSDVRVSDLEKESWYPLGRIGDVRQSEWIYDTAIVVERPNWHAMVQGITGFAASAT